MKEFHSLKCLIEKEICNFENLIIDLP